jgi:hypothetical protein
VAVAQADASKTVRPFQVQSGRRSTGWPLAKLIVGGQELTVWSALNRWIPTQSASKDAVGDILLDRRLHVTLPVLRWRRLDILTFDPDSPFGGLTITLARRARIAEELRCRGYTVTDR